MSIRIGILGYGNLGRGVECAIKHNPDMELVGVFTRRAPESVKILTETAKVYSVDDAEKMKDQIDVMILCGGSATDLPEQTPKYAQWFNVVDSFDTHKRIPEHFANVDKRPGLKSSFSPNNCSESRFRTGVRNIIIILQNINEGAV
jgi:diaminopimelate dehydrogenase